MPSAPIVGENVAKLGPIVGNMADLWIFRFYDIRARENLVGSQSRIFIEAIVENRI